MNPSRKMAIVAVVIAVVVAASGFYLFQFGSPEERKGAVEGTVTDHDGNPVAGMVVYIVSGTTAFPEIAVETSEEGYYRIGSVSPGTFEVAVHDRQGNRIGLESVVVRSGEISTLNFVITPTPVQMISFDEAVEYALKGGEPKWPIHYRWLGEFEGEPFVTPDGLVEGHLEWRASNGTLYEAEYPSGEIHGEIERFTGVEDTGEYYVWMITLMDGMREWIDARNGELLSFSPHRVPGVLTFEAAVRIVYAPQKRIEEWRVQEYKRIGDFEFEPYETPDGLVKGHLLWRASNGTLYEVQLPFILDIRGKVLYIEVPDDTEEYNVWEITTEDNVYYIDARNGIIRLILGETPVPPPTKLLLAYSLNITFPSMPVTVRRGESVTLPVAIKSWVDDEPIKIRLALVSSSDWDVPLPEFITYEVEGYISVNPHETVPTQITIKISEDALLGKYSFVLHGELEKPLEGYSGMAYHFSLVVVS